jgi:hypothetical protein
MTMHPALAGALLLVAAQPCAQTALVPAGSINEALAKREQVVILIEDEPGIRRHAELMRAQLFRGAEIVTDAEAATRDLAGCELVIYGTPAHAWVKALGERLPVRFSDGKVRVEERQFEGTQLRVICAVRSPHDPARRAILYLAARSADVVEINALYHGPTEWVVADGARELASGSFALGVEGQRADLDWLLEKVSTVHPATTSGLPPSIEAAAASARAALDRPRTRGELWFLFNPLLMALRDAHSAFAPLPTGEALDLPLRWLQEGLIVADDTALLRRGDRVVKVGAHSETELLDALRRIVPAETDHWIRVQGPPRLRDLAILRGLGIAEAAPVAVTVERGGQQHELAIPLGTAARAPRQAPLPWVRWTIEREHSLGIFTLDRCVVDDEYRRVLGEFFAAVHEAGVSRIAVDVRNNAGGNSAVVDEFLRYLDVPAYFSYGGEVRQTADSLLQRKQLGLPGYQRHPPARRENRRHERPPPFAGEVSILTSNRTFSSGNWFAVIFRDNELGEIVGEPTGNAPSSFGDVLSFTLPASQLSFTLSFKKWVRPDPERDPADCLVPDHAVALTRQHLLDGTDPVLDFLRQRKDDKRK